MRRRGVTRSDKRLSHARHCRRGEGGSGGGEGDNVRTSTTHAIVKGKNRNRCEESEGWGDSAAEKVLAGELRARSDRCAVRSGI